MNKIRIAICDDAQHLCINIKNFCKYSTEIEFIGYCTNSASCVDMVASLKPDILLLDIEMDTPNAGIKLIPDILAITPPPKIIMLTAYSNSSYIFESLVAGASDYLVKSCTNSEIMDKIKSVYQGNNNLEHEILAKFTQKSAELAAAHNSLIFMLNKMITLSSTEMEVLKELYDGKNYSDIAQQRFVEPSTVRSMASRILKKFDMTNMNDLISTLRETKVFELFFNS